MRPTRTAVSARRTRAYSNVATATTIHDVVGTGAYLVSQNPARKLSVFWFDNSDNEDGFIVGHSKSPTGPFVEVARPAPDETSVVFDLATDERFKDIADGIHYFTVNSFKGPNPVVPTFEPEGGEAWKPDPAVPQPTLLRIEQTGVDSIRLHVRSNITGDEPQTVTTYYTQSWGDTPGYAQFQVGPATLIDNYVDDHIVAGTTNRFRAYNQVYKEGIGFSSGASELVIDGPPIPAPTAFTATPGTPGEDHVPVTLSWNYGGPPIRGFIIKRSVDNGPFREIARFGDNFGGIGDIGPGSFSYPTGAPLGAACRYLITGFDRDGGWPGLYGRSPSDAYATESAVASIQTAPVAPDAPDELRAVAYCGGGVDLAWVDSSGNEDGFRITRTNLSDGTEFTQTVTADTAQFHDETGLTTGVTYRYTVAAFNGGGNSGSPEPAQVTPTPFPEVRVEAIDPSAGEAGPNPGRFIVWRSGTCIGRPLDVTFTMSGTATPGADYAGLASPASIAAGYFGTVVELMPRSDAEVEPVETAVMRLVGGPYTLMSASTATVTIDGSHAVGDLDIDSDNTNAFTSPDRTPAEENAEDASGQPGKMIAVNDDDGDGDFIPDFADGFDHFDNTTDDQRVTGESFVPLVLELPAGTDYGNAKIKFSYPGSDPAAVRREGTTPDSYQYIAAPGSLRIWVVEGDMPRSALPFHQGGYYIARDVPLRASDLGFSEQQRAVTFYVEAVEPSASMGQAVIEAFVDRDGDGPADFASIDKVGLTAVDVDVLIGADDPNDTSLADDWVGANLHTIQNFVKVDGPANLNQLPQSQQLTLTIDGTGTGGGSFYFDNGTGIPIHTFTAAGAKVFQITGVSASGALDDIRIHASYKGQIFGSETLTILRFGETGVQTEVGTEARPLASMTYGNVIVNPAIRRNARDVVAFDVGVIGQSQALLHDGSHYSGTTPRLNQTNMIHSPIGKKFDVGSIEVSWARQIVSGGVPSPTLSRMSTDGHFPPDPLGVSIAQPGDNGGSIRSNLRVTDADTTATGQDGNEYVYYLGHPTERFLQGGDLLNNYAQKLEIDTAADKVYRLNLHVVQFQPPGGGAMVTTGLTNQDLDRIAVEASRIWEQVGVRFGTLGRFTETVTAVTQWDLPDDDPDTLKALTTTNRVNGIDVYLVNTISDGAGGWLSGSTAFEASPAYSWRESGCVVATRRLGPTSAREDISVIARTVAHEIGHYLMNTHLHEDDIGWNLMRPGGGTTAGAGTTNNSDLLRRQRDAIVHTPEAVNSDED